MTLFKYQISPHHEADVRASGFDIHDPDKRHPVRPHPLKKALETARSTKDPRVQALLKSRENAGHVLSRGIGGVLLFGLIVWGLIAWPMDAFACPDHPGLCDPIAQQIAAKITHQENDRLLPVLVPKSLTSLLPDIRDPIWLFILLTALVGLKALALLLHACSSRTFKLETSDMPNLQLTMLINDDLPVAKVPEKTSLKYFTPPKSEISSETEYKWLVKGASRTGKFRQENQDAFAVCNYGGHESCFVLCDGAGGHAGGREASHRGVEEILPLLDIHSGTTIPIDPIQRLEHAISRARFSALNEERKGITTAILCVMEGSWLYYATLCDGALSIVWPDGMVSDLLTPHHILGQPSNIIGAYIGDNCQIPARLGAVRLEAGCMVLAMSDGASDIFGYEHFAEKRDQYRKLFLSGDIDLPNELLVQVENARDLESGTYLHNDNMTLIMALLTREESDNG